MPFSPTDIGGCVLWISGDQITGLSDGDPISTAPNGGSSGNPTAGGAVRPVYKTNIINSLPVMRFDGADDMLTTGSFAAGSVFAALAVASGGNTGIVSGIFGQLGTDAQNVRREILSTTAWRGEGNTNSGDFTDGGGHFYVGGVETNAAADTVWHYLSALAAAQVPSRSWSVGGQSGAGRYLGCDLAEMVVYDSVLGTTDRQRVEAYLSVKYFGSPPPPPATTVPPDLLVQVAC